MPIFTQTLIQGQGAAFTVTLNPPAAFEGTEALAATVSTGGTDAALLTLTPTWSAGQTAGSYTRVDLAYTSEQAASLAPGYYVVTTTLADNSAALAWGLLTVLSAPGQQPAQDFLVSPAEVLGLLPDVATATTLASLPRVIGAATDAIRRYCSRNFTRVTVTKEFRPSYEGLVRLDEIPVNQVLRIAAGRDNALSITGPSTAQIASVRSAFTGDLDSGLTATGLILSSTSSAVATETTLLYADYPTLASLAAAVNAVGGWQATTQAGYSPWPSTELVGTDAAQGALSGAMLDVYSEDVAMERLDPFTGMLQLGTGLYGSSLNTPAWGPDWGQFATPRFPTRVRVTYDAGFATIPSPVVMAAIEIIQAAFSRLATDQALRSETADDYSYTLRDQLDAIPESARKALAPYRIYNA